MTEISFEVGGITLLLPLEDRKRLAGQEHTFSRAGSKLSPAVLQHRPCPTATAFPATPTQPVLQVASSLGKACPPLSSELLSLWRQHTHTHSFHRGSLGSGFAADHTKLHVSIFRDFIYIYIYIYLFEAWLCTEML